MSDLTPIEPVKLPPLPPFRPYPNVQPFTDADGDTYTRSLARLVEFVNAILEAVSKSEAELHADVYKQLQETRDTVQAALNAQTEANNAAILALEAYVNAKVQEILDSSIELNDTLMSQLLAEQTSATRTALDAQYVRREGAVTKVAGRVGDVVLTPEDVNASTSATSGTIPLREAAGRVPGVGTPTAATHAANKGYTDSTVDAAVTPISENVTELESVMITADDVFFTGTMQGTRQGTTMIVDASSNHYNVFMTAPFHMELTDAWVVMGETPNEIQPSGSPNKHFDLVLRRFRTNSDAGQIVQVPVRATNPIKPREAFSLAGGVWNEQNRILAPGDSVAFGLVISDGYVFKYPVAVTVKYRRKVV